MSDDAPLIDDGMCFGCGPHNPIGLHLQFAWSGDIYSARWTPGQDHQGWVGRVHGGLLATALDEVLARAALERHGKEWVTAELTTRLKHPVPVGCPLRIEATIESVRRALIVCRGSIRDETTGTILATGQAKMMRVK